jgi:hypothetical protein
VGEQRNYCVDDIPDKINNVDALAMATPEQETIACEKRVGMGNDTMSFASVVVNDGNKSIQAAQ